MDTEDNIIPIEEEINSFDILDITTDAYYRLLSEKEKVSL